MAPITGYSTYRTPSTPSYSGSEVELPGMRAAQRRRVPAPYSSGGRLDTSAFLPGTNQADLSSMLSRILRSNSRAGYGINPMTGNPEMGSGGKTFMQRLFGGTDTPNIWDKMAYVINGKIFHPTGGVTHAPYQMPSYELPVISSEGTPFWAGGSAVPALQEPFLDPYYGSTFDLGSGIGFNDYFDPGFSALWD